MLEHFVSAFQMVVSWQMLLVVLFGACAGVTIGAIPGLTGVMTIALILPMTLYMPSWVGISLILAIYKSSMYGGSISAILLRTPGTPAAAMTAIDGYALKEKGQAKKALQTALFSSFSADMFSDLVLLTVAPLLGLLALRFGAPEFTTLIGFSLFLIASISRNSMVKGLIAALLGVLVGTIGLDPITSAPRFSFDNTHLMSGLSFMPLLIGLFAISEVLIQIESFLFSSRQAASSQTSRANVVQQSDEGLSFQDIKGLVVTWFRSSVIGTFMGAIPGVGGAVAPFVAYGDAQRRAKDPDKFGSGALEGITATESANNSVCGANLIPLLTLGIPGDVVAAMLMSSLMIHGLRPGPLLLRENPNIIYGFFISLAFASVAYLLVGLLFNRFVVRLTTVAPVLLVPAILSVCVAGSYAFNHSMFDVQVMLIFGLLGYGMRKLQYNMPAFLIAFILSPLFETSFRRAMVLSRGDLTVFVRRPVALVFLVGLVVSLVILLVREYQQYQAKRPAK